MQAPENRALSLAVAQRLGLELEDLRPYNGRCMTYTTGCLCSGCVRLAEEIEQGAVTFEHGRLKRKPKATKTLPWEEAA